MYISIKFAPQTEELLESVKNSFFSEYSFIAKGTVISRAIQIFEEKEAKFPDPKEQANWNLRATHSTRLNLTAQAANFIDDYSANFKISKTAVIHAVLATVLSMNESNAKKPLRLRILSLNVNDFGGLENLEEYKKYKSYREWDQMDKSEQMKKIYDFICDKNPDVVTLQEYDEHSKEGKVFSKWMIEKYTCVPHSQHERSSITIMFVKRELQYSTMKNPHNRDLRASLIRTPLNGKEICIYGVHVPYEDINFWDELILSYKQISKEYELMIIGDLNVYQEGTKEKEKYKELIKDGGIDLWLAAGYPDYVFTHRQSRLDYAVVSKKLKEIVKDITINPELLYKECTDHAALIVDICCP